jgi:hypothetical protein
MQIKRRKKKNQQTGMRYKEGMEMYFLKRKLKGRGNAFR